jgi:hypothetical protein
MAEAGNVSPLRFLFALVLPILLPYDLVPAGAPAFFDESTGRCHLKGDGGGRLAAAGRPSPPPFGGDTRDWKGRGREEGEGDEGGGGGKRKNGGMRRGEWETKGGGRRVKAVAATASALQRSPLSSSSSNVFLLPISSSLKLLQQSPSTNPRATIHPPPPSNSSLSEALRPILKDIGKSEW